MSKHDVFSIQWIPKIIIKMRMISKFACINSMAIAIIVFLVKLISIAVMCINGQSFWIIKLIIFSSWLRLKFLIWNYFSVFIKLSLSYLLSVRIIVCLFSELSILIELFFLDFIPFWIKLSLLDQISIFIKFLFFF